MPPRIRTDEWCERNLTITDDSGTQHTRFSFKGRAWLRGIFEAIDDPDIETIDLIKSAQIGGTTFTLAVAASRPAVDPCPMMFAGPDAPYCAEKARLLYHYAEATEQLTQRIPPPHKRKSKREVLFNNCICYLAWSGSPQTMSGRPCRFVLCSEVDRWVDDPKHGQSAEVIQARVNSFPYGSKILRESTPTDETSAIDAFYQESDQRKFHCPCPHCGHYQELRLVPHRDGPYAGKGGIAGIQTTKGDWLTPQAARRKAYYLCEQGCRIDSGDKPAMIDRGLWVAKGQTVDKRGRVTGIPERSKRNAGFHLSALYTHFTWGRIAAAYLRARATGAAALRVFWNNWLGMAWKQRSKLPKWRDLGRRLAGDHRRGHVPAAAWFLTGAADVQANRVYWGIRAWGAHATSWSIDWGCCRQSADDAADDEDADGKPEGEVASDLAQLSGLVVRRRLPVAGINPWGQAELPLALCGIDSNYRTMQVLAFVRAHPGGHVRAIGGDPKPQPGRLYHRSDIEANARTGKPYPGGLEKWWIDTSVAKEDVQARWSLAIDAPGAWLLPADILTHPDGEDYLRQVVNEALVLEVMPSGKRVKRWRLIDSGRGNHYLDIEGYHFALANMVTGGDFSPENLHRLAASAAPAKRRPSNEPPPDLETETGIDLYR